MTEKLSLLREKIELILRIIGILLNDFNQGFFMKEKKVFSIFSTYQNSLDIFSQFSFNPIKKITVNHFLNHIQLFSNSIKSTKKLFQKH
jgi:hypothetical protein